MDHARASSGLREGLTESLHPAGLFVRFTGRCLAPVRRLRERAVLMRTVAVSVHDLTAWSTATIIVHRGRCRRLHCIVGLTLKAGEEDGLVLSVPERAARLGLECNGAYRAAPRKWAAPSCWKRASESFLSVSSPYARPEPAADGALHNQAGHARRAYS